MGDAGNRERADKHAFTAVRNRAFDFTGGFLGVAERYVGNRHQPPARVPAEVGNPAIIRPAVGRGQCGVKQFGLPDQPQGRVENGLVHVLAVKQFHPLLHIHGAEGRALEIGQFRPRSDRPHLFGPYFTPHGPLAQFGGLVHLFAHTAQGAQDARPGQLGPPGVNLQVFIAVVRVHPDTQRPVTILGIKVLFPQVGRFEDMAVTVNEYRIGCHISPLCGIRLNAVQRYILYRDVKH